MLIRARQWCIPIARLTLNFIQNTYDFLNIIIFCGKKSFCSWFTIMRFNWEQNIRTDNIILTFFCFWYTFKNKNKLFVCIPWIFYNIVLFMFMIFYIFCVEENRLRKSTLEWVFTLAWLPWVLGRYNCFWYEN